MTTDPTDTGRKMVPDGCLSVCGECGMDYGHASSCRYWKPADPTDTSDRSVTISGSKGGEPAGLQIGVGEGMFLPTDTVQAGETKTFERALLGVDGNYGFALLGEDLQSGECEFVEIALPLSASKDPRRYHDSEWCRAAQTAASLAYVQLTLRLGRKFAYALDRSHPRYA